jgi:D-alanyl-lipoteichoic acid acyltransferase DltB (MBOAT superfamily)
MLFPTIDFAIFFALVFPLTWLLNEHNTAKKCFLVAASYYFYAHWNASYTLILFGSSLFNFALALALDRLPDGGARRTLFWLGVAGNLGLLGYFKYYNFFVASAMNLMLSLGLPFDMRFIEVALPIAISFLTFHALSYIIDVYQRKIPASRSLIDILLYISFFPHLIAGPIVRAKAFLGQTVKRSDPYDIRLGLAVFLITGGLFKKVIVANYLSTDFVDGVFRSPADYSHLDLLFGMYAYAIQIYCDFSAYTDIAIGIANLLGYRFPQNFNQPYRALSVQDFWRRWHMTLSSWLRDYLYIPLGGNRAGELMTYRNIMITMGLGGLWHGASATFVVWGLLHGAALVAERMFARGRKTLPGLAVPGWLSGALAWLLTVHFVCVAWVIFRAPSLAAAQDYFAALLWSDAGWSTSMTPLVAAMLAIGAATQIVPNRWVEDFEAYYDRAALSFKVALPFGLIYLIAIAAPGGVPPFIYFQF